MARNKAPKAKKSYTSPVSDANKPVIIAVTAIILVFLLFIIAIGLLFTNFLSRFTEDDTASGQVTTMTYSIKSRTTYVHGQNGTGSIYGNTGSSYSYDLYGDDGADMAGETTLPKVTSNYGTGSEFEYGTIKGNTYKSKFSGMTFDAPSGWTLVGASKSSVTPTSVLDLNAYNSSGTMNVKLQYFSLSGGNYSSTDQVLKALKTQLGSDVELESKSKSIAGNNFKGFAFDGVSGQDTARSQVMVAQVKGYALVLQVVAPTQSDINKILKNFS